MADFANFLFLAGLPTGGWIAILAGAVVVFGVLGFFSGNYFRKKKTDKRLGEIDSVVSKMLDDARVESKSIKKTDVKTRTTN